MASQVITKYGSRLAQKAACSPAKANLTRPPCKQRKATHTKGYHTIKPRTMQMAAIRNAAQDDFAEQQSRPLFFAEMEREIKRLNRNDSILSLMLIEVDQFTRLAEQNGVEDGERVMVELSRLLKHALRITDLPARLGGEEFGVLLPDTDAKGAITAAERFRGSVLEQFDKGSNQVPFPITVSIGIASTSMLNAADASELFKQADTRKYIAKHSGANQVSFDELSQLH